MISTVEMDMISSAIDGAYDKFTRSVVNRLEHRKASPETIDVAVKRCNTIKERMKRRRA